MVFVRATKTAIKRLLISLFFVFAIILATTVIVSNAVSARTGMDIPVEVNWSDQNPSSRPSSVTLRLMNGTTEVSNITLTSSNVDPSDSNKWVGVFASVPYNANYTIVEDSVSNYSITNNNLSPTISAVKILNSASNTTTYTRTNTTHNLGDVNFIVVRSDNNYYVWTLESYPTGTKRTELTSAIRGMIGNNNATISSYEDGLPATIGNYWFLGGFQTSISGSEGNISIRTSTGIFGGSISAVYYGNLVPGTTDGVSFENVKTIPTYTLTVHHLNEDDTQFAPDVVTTYNEGDPYTTSPISHPRYTSELAAGQDTGTMTQDTVVTYVYHPKYHNVIYQFTGSVQPPNANQLLPATDEYEIGATVPVAQNPTASGYRFLGWKINGSDAGTSFTMPSSDVTITGSWEQFNGYFAPTISKQVTNPQSVYRFGDTVEFLVTVSNTESYPITNVEVTEGLSGARFIAASGYTVSNGGDVATIATIPANGTAVLYAEYDITDDVTQTGRTNTVEITAASASNYYYLDTSQSITASASFDTQSWQDVPVLTGVDVSSSTTLLYYFLLVLGAGGIVGGVVVVNKRKEDD